MSKSHDNRSPNEREEDPSETTALLEDGSEHGDTSIVTGQQQQQWRRPRLRRPGLSVSSVTSSIAGNLKNVPKVHKSSTIVNLLCAIVFVASMCDGFVDLPLTRILEDILCRGFYDKDVNTTGKLGMPPIDEKLCKENAIQEQLAFIIALQQTLTSIVGFFAAFPWGLAADKIGRKPVVALCILSGVLNISWIFAVLYWHSVFPVTAIWYSCLFHLIGGGTPVTQAILLSMVTDATSEEERGVAFVRIFVSGLGGTLLSPSLAALVMQKAGPWVSPWIGMSFLIIALIAFVFVPETLTHHRKTASSPTSPPAQTSTSPDHPSSLWSGLKVQITHVASEFRESLSILKSPSLILLLVTLISHAPVLYATLSFMNQFVSKRYAISIAQTGYVQTVYSVAFVIQSLVILPLLSKFLTRPSTSAHPTTNSAPNLKFWPKDEHHRDLWLARVSYIALGLGTLVLALAPTLPGFMLGLVITGIGAGSNSLTRSLMSIYVDPEHRSRLFSLASMFDVMGRVYGQPMLAGLFAVGLNLGGEWIGLPYLGVAGIVIVCGSLLVFIRLPTTTRRDGVGGGEDDNGNEETLLGGFEDNE
ncbi:MFS general substrate transporter [Xylariaceae sp. FL0255]|nr:MFS general substrate transporter [Xylariaceae sp. FL0255]